MGSIPADNCSYADNCIILAALRQLLRRQRRDDVAELQSEGGEILGGTPEQFSTLLRAEVPRWAKIVKESGATLD